MRRTRCFYTIFCKENIPLFNTSAPYHPPFHRPIIKPLIPTNEVSLGSFTLYLQLKAALSPCEKPILMLPKAHTNHVKALLSHHRKAFISLS